MANRTKQQGSNWIDDITKNSVLTTDSARSYPDISHLDEHLQKIISSTLAFTKKDSALPIISLARKNQNTLTAYRSRNFEDWIRSQQTFRHSKRAIWSWNIWATDCHQRKIRLFLRRQPSDQRSESMGRFTPGPLNSIARTRKFLR